MKHIIDFVAYFTSPTMHGGQLRIHNYNKELSKYFKITQISFTPVICFVKKIDHTYTYKEIIVWNPIFTLLVIWLKLFKKYSYDYIIPLAFKFYPRFLISRYLKNIDIVQLEHPWLAKFVYGFKRFNGKKKIFVAHNVESELYNYIYHNKKITKKVKEIEKYAAHKSSNIFCVSNSDKEFFIKYNNNVTLVPNGIYSGEFEKLKLRQNERRIILFAGSNHPPNIDAANFIISILAPQMLDFDFVIMGSVFSESSKQGNVIITGPVSNIGKNKWFNRADMFINPVESGSGSNLKMLEYMWFNRPIVTTHCGARGFESIDELNVVALDEFVSSVRDNICKEVIYDIDEYFYDNIVKKVKKYY